MKDINKNELLLSLKEYSKKDISKAVWQIATSFGPYLFFFAVSYLLWDEAKVLALMSVILNSFFLVRIFIIQHDCGHHSFFDPETSEKWNRIWGWVGSIFSTLPFVHWAKVHHYHHLNTGKLEARDIGDIDFKTVDEYRKLTPFRRWGYRVFRSAFTIFIIVPVYYFVVANRNPYSSTFKGMTMKIRISQVLNNLLIVVVYTMGALLLGWKFLVVQAITVFFFSLIAFWFFFVQHSHERTYQKWYDKGEWQFVDASLKGASRYDLHPVFHWLTGNIGFHHIHHLNSTIPSYRLQEADAATYPTLKDTINNLSFWQSLSCVFNKLWDEAQQKYISFREFYEMENV